MSELLKSLQESSVQISKLCSTLVNAVNYAGNITREADDKLKQVEAREKSVSVKLSALSVREADIAKIENIVDLEKSAKEAEKRNALALDKIIEAQLAFEKTAKETLKDINAKEAKLADENKALVKGWEALRAKEKSYRSEIEADIMKRFKK